MNNNINFSENQGFLSRIFERCDEEDEQTLAKILVKELGLTVGSASFTEQVQLLIGRRLTESEKFKIENLEREFKFPKEESGNA